MLTSDAEHVSGLDVNAGRVKPYPGRNADKYCVRLLTPAVVIWTPVTQAAAGTASESAIGQG